MFSHVKKFVAIILAFIICLGVVQTANSEQLTNLQLNAIAMLNYITVLSQEINSAKNNRLYLEKAYSSLVNNLYPNAIDGDSLSQLMLMMDIMEDCRMLSIKRERVEYIYDQSMANAIYSIIPSPMDFISLVQAGSKAEKVAILADIVVDSAASYFASRSQAENDYIQSGWELDDEEAALIHEGRKNLFAYMVSMTNLYDLPGYLTLTEKSVQDFVDWKNNDNPYSRIQFYESNSDIYRSYGGYWLALAECYYEIGEYSKCLEAIETYRSLNIQIFRKDYDLANILPIALAAVEALNSNGDMNNTIEAFVQLLIDNTDNDNWALRYVAAQTYIDLYTKTKEQNYLKMAYNIVLDNVNWLVNEQRNINALYLAPVQAKEAPKDASGKEKDQINQYNQMLNEKRKKEFPEIFEPLRLNVDTLMQIADELKIDSSEAMRIDGILHLKGNKLFLNERVDQLYWATQPAVDSVNPELISFAGTAIRIPVSYIAEDGTIIVSVKEKDEPEETILDDWMLTDVKRDSETNIADIYAIYTSENAKKHIWKPESIIKITVIPKANCNAQEIISNYTAEEAKTNFLDYLKFWEGHKNEWYDYLKVWENTVNFVYVDNSAVSN